ncbi:hypothetical protein D9757_011588 [Collybiopsis confluens]|uniref:Fungal lipase-type domain-containing protein n=1 Tax=Collybiopsis confluens TaxID=2823264 RepID=A0A8H5LHA0_9AGAR|nr:hypothetical protein D9757_011588 [Collybiopsis confluens]
MVFHALYSGIALAIAFAAASPAPHSPVHSRQSITALSGSQISAFTPYTFFASTAYCQPSTTLSWTCGANCEANPGFIPVASGGDGDGTQFWYVGYDPTLNTVIVAHQGTDFSEIEAALTDADFFLESLSSSLFPGVSSSVEAHNGFADEQAKTASAVLAAVKQAMAAHSTTSIATVGHSLGAALSLLDALYLTLQIPSATVKFFGYGLPRVGNQAFANLIDSTLPNRVSHVNNKEDLVPILPGMFLGFHHPSGEKHIMDDNSWVACPGQDNPSNECVVGVRIWTFLISSTEVRATMMDRTVQLRWDVNIDKDKEQGGFFEIDRFTTLLYFQIELNHTQSQSGALCCILALLRTIKKFTRLLKPPLGEWSAPEVTRVQPAGSLRDGDQPPPFYEYQLYPRTKSW